MINGHHDAPPFGGHSSPFSMGDKFPDPRRMPEPWRVPNPVDLCFFLRVHPYGGLFIYKLGTVRDGQSLVIEQL